MAFASSSRGLPLRPLAVRFFTQRRRWMRWAAIALAVLTLLSAASQFGRKPVGHHPAAAPAAPAPGPTSLTPEGRVRGEEGAYRRSLPSRGAVFDVPADTRIVSVIVPASPAVSPRSRVDVVAAFDTGQERVVRRILASALVLKVSVASSSLSGTEGRFAGAPMAELSLAIPAGREREVVLAQAFGRLFVLVAGASRSVPSGASEGTLSMRRYLGLPAAAMPSYPSAPLVFPPLAPFAPPAASWTTAAARGAAAAGHPRAQAPKADSGPADRAPVNAGSVVEIIEGTGRSFVQVAP
jgi:hypothetical protein